MKKRQKMKVGLLLGLMSIPSLMYANTSGIVVADQLNIRAIPSTTGMVVKQVNYGDTLQLINKEQSAEGWYQVLLDNNEKAYVRDEFIKIESVSGIVNENNLNFRSYPSLTQSTIMKKLPIGAEVTVLYRVGDFYKVLYKGNFGFVYVNYVDVPFLECVGTQDIANVKDVASLQVMSPEEDQSLSPMQDAEFSMDTWTYQGILEEQNDFDLGEPISEEMGRNIVGFALQYVGNPYVYGGNDLITGVDCSGFTQQVMKAFQINLPRTSREQSKTGMVITDYDALQPGDLLFFGNSEDEINHVGIYMGDGCIVHASTPETGIIISNISERGFATLQVARRMMQ